MPKAHMRVDAIADFYRWMSEEDWTAQPEPAVLS